MYSQRFLGILCNLVNLELCFSCILKSDPFCALGFFFFCFSRFKKNSRWKRNEFHDSTSVYTCHFTCSLLTHHRPPQPSRPISLFAFLLHIFFLSHFSLPFSKNSSSFCIIVSFLSLPTHKHAYTFNNF